MLLPNREQASKLEQPPTGPLIIPWVRRYRLRLPQALIAYM